MTGIVPLYAPTTQFDRMAADGAADIRRGLGKLRRAHAKALDTINGSDFAKLEGVNGVFSVASSRGEEFLGALAAVANVLDDYDATGSVAGSLSRIDLGFGA